jgi:hypothetical protein
MRCAGEGHGVMTPRVPLRVILARTIFLPTSEARCAPTGHLSHDQARRAIVVFERVDLYGEFLRIT